MSKLKNSDKYNDLDEKLKNVIELRLKNQDSSLSELCNLYEKKYGESLSKSGLKHRLNRIENLANNLKEEA